MIEGQRIMTELGPGVFVRWITSQCGRLVRAGYVVRLDTGSTVFAVVYTGARA